MAPSLKSQTLSLFSGKIVGYLAMSLIPIILVRLLSPDQFGAYRQIWFLYGVFLPVMQFQIPHSLYYFYPRKKERIHQYLSQTLTLLSINGIIGSSIFVLIGLYFKALPSGLKTDYVVPVALFFMIESVAGLVEHIFILEKQPRLTFITTVVNSILRLIIVVGAVYLFKDVFALAFGLVLWSTIRLITVVVYIFRKHPIRIGFPNIDSLRDQLGYAAPIALGGIVGLIGAQIDKGIISGYMSPQDFAIYSIGGLGILGAVKLLYTSVGNVFVPRFGELAQNNNFESIRLLWHKMIILNAIATIPIVTFAIVYAPQFITILYTDTYIQAVALWRLNMMVLIIQMIGFGYIPRALRQTGAIFSGNIVRFIISVPLSIILILKMGLIGGAIAFVVGFWSNGIVQLYACKSSLGITLKTLLPWTKLLLVIFLCALASTVLPVFSEISEYNFIQLAIGAIYFFPSVAVMFIICEVVEIKEIRLLFHRRSPKFGKRPLKRLKPS